MTSERLIESIEQVDDEGARLSRDQGGFVLPWIALMLLVLIAMAGFGVDVWHWWYSAQKVQRAADAGALAGVPFMPGNLGGSAPNATTTALAVVKQNGYPTAVVAQGPKANQLVVTVSDTVDNYFTSLLGIDTTTLTRSATAEFNAPVQMGSPSGHLANDPENGAVDQHWLNIGAPHVNKQTGDRFADFTSCTSGVFACTSGRNTEYSDLTYVFSVDIPSIPVGGADIQAYDPEYANGEGGSSSCNNFWIPATGANSVQALMASDPARYGPDSPARYAPGQTPYCPGDDSTNLGTPQATAWLVRGPATSTQGSLFQPLDNPVVGGGGPNGPCAHQFKGYNPNGASNQSTYWFDLLDPGNTSTFDQDFYQSFHRWYTLCHVSTPGRYFIQVRSSVPFSLSQRDSATYLSTDQDPPQDSNIGGQNRYSLRAVNGATNTVVSGAQVYGVERLPVYTNTTGSNTPNFYLARMLPGGGTTGRILSLRFYDIGDLSSGTTTTLTVQPPTDATGGPITCTNWVFNNNNGNAAPAGSSFNGCTLHGITSNPYPNGFNGVLVTVNINVPGSYDCNVIDPNGCWFKIRMSYTGNAPIANDTTTWAASIGGDPVRLVK